MGITRKTQNDSGNDEALYLSDKEARYSDDYGAPSFDEGLTDRREVLTRIAERTLIARLVPSSRLAWDGFAIYALWLVKDKCVRLLG